MTQIPPIVDFADPTYDPFAAEDGVFGEISDIHARIDQLRTQGDVLEGSFMSLLGFDWPTDVPTFTLLSYDHVARSLTDFKAFSNECFKGTLGLTFGRTISAMDPPEHPRYRRIFQKAFLPQNIARWGDEIVEVVVNDLVSKFRDQGKADLIDQFTKLYPFQVIYRLLDLPERDGPIFHKLSAAQNMVYTPEGQEAASKLGEFFTRLVEERRRDPGGDLASALINVEVEGEKLPEDVIVSFLRQLINAAGDTTFRGTSVMLTGLLTNPAQLEALRQDRSLMNQSIEEALRWDPPVTWTERTAAVDMQIDDIAIPAGSKIVPVLASANIDDAVFDHGETFDIFRKRTKPPIIFAFGPHMCVGQHLARLEMTRAMTALLDRLPNLRLDPAMPGPVVRGAMLRYPKHLHVLFD